MTKVSVHPLDGVELERGYVRLLHAAYCPLYELTPEFVDCDLSIWSWLEGHVLANEMHRWVLVTEEEEVVGHLAAVPQYFRINGHRVVAHMPADFVVLPEYHFYAFSLVQTFFQACKNCIAWDQKKGPILIEGKMGAKKAGELQYAVKVLNVLELPSLPSWIPALIPRLLNSGLRVVDKALANSFGCSSSVKVLEGFDDSFDKMFSDIAAAVPCLPEKDVAFLRWRYGPGSPIAPVTLLGVSGEEGLMGYAVLRVTSKVPKEGYLLDLMTLPGRYDVARALCREAVRHFAHAGVYVIRYRFMESLTSLRRKDLWRMGFLNREESNNTLLVKFADRSLHKMSLNAANWSYSAGDGIASCFGSFQPSR